MDSGIWILQNTWKLVAPSRRAASSMELGIHETNVFGPYFHRVVIIQSVPVGKRHFRSELRSPKIVFPTVNNEDVWFILSGSPNSQAEGFAVPGIAVLGLRLVVHCLFDHLLTSKFD